MQFKYNIIYKIQAVISVYLTTWLFQVTKIVQDMANSQDITPVISEI